MIRRKITQLSMGVVLVGLPLALSTSVKAQTTPPPCHTTYVYNLSDTDLQACGMHKFPLERVGSLSDGGKEYFYRVDGAQTIYRVPPAGFDPLKASAEELALYYFPPRPTTEPELDQWTADMAKAHSVTPPAAIITVPSTNTTSYTNNHWSGYMAKCGGCGGRYNEVYGQYNQPQNLATACQNPDETTWAGIGGWGTSDLGQAGTDGQYPYVAGTTVNYAAWSQVLPDQKQEEIVYGLTGNPGWRFTVKVQHVSGAFDFYLQDSSTGNYASFGTGSSNYDGSSAEFITERPLNTNTNTLYNLTDFGYVVWKGAWVNGTSPSNALGYDPYNSPITMQTAGGTRLANPGSMFNSGQSFQDNYDNCN